jgi:iron complex transport system permease protein
MKNRRFLFSLVVIFMLLAVSSVAGILIGTAQIPLGHGVGALMKALGLPVTTTWRPWVDTIITDVRMPRVLVAALVGSALAVSGAGLQGLFRNPLADPGVIGVSSGASLGAIMAIYCGLAAKSIWAIPAFAFVGATTTAFLVYGIATRRGYTPVGTLLLAGIAVGSLNISISSGILALALKNYEVGRQLLYWMLGGLEGRTWNHVQIAIGPTLIGAAVVAMHARDLDAMLLGEVHAASVGVDVQAVRRRLIITTSLITGAAVAVSGTIGFVGLVVPHILRLIVGPGHHKLLPIAAIGGAVFVVLADIFARTIIAPEEMRLGVVTSMVGAPFFLWLLVRRRVEATI